VPFDGWSCSTSITETNARLDLNILRTVPVMLFGSGDIDRDSFTHE
jgi:hypothetical protein